MRIRPEFLYPASESMRFKWPERMRYCGLEAYTQEGRYCGLVYLDTLSYLPVEHVSLYARLGLVMAVILQLDRERINTLIEVAYYKAGNQPPCRAIIDEPIYRSREFIADTKSQFTVERVGDAKTESAIRREMRMMLAPGSHTKQDWRRVMQRDGWKCLRCGSSKHLTKDHVVPIARGGANDASNLQTLCRSCNSWKGAKHIDFRMPAAF